jgi:hypothetical protein
MAIRDNKISWKLKREWIPVHMMSGFLESAGVQTSLGAGGTVFKEALAAAQISGIQMTTADEIFHYWPLPWDLDKDSPLWFRLHFAHDAADLDTPVFKVFVKGIGEAALLTAANATPDETLSISHAVAANAGGLEITDWAKSASQGYISSTDRALLLAVELDALGGAGADEITLLGMEICWKVQATQSAFSDTKSASLIT